ncbi:MAG: HigA family addiction module antitoxin [Hyphomicrobium sp.]
MKKKLEPISPGEILYEEFMRPFSISQNQLARDLGVNPARIHEIVRAKRGISAETALRLAAYFQTTGEFWMSLQARYDLKLAERAHGAIIKKSVRPSASIAA